MTTINNLIDKVGGIEKAIEIVSGAPETSTHYFDGRYFEEWSHNGWVTSINGQWHDCKKPTGKLIDLNNLRTAIAKHDTTDHVTTQLCIGYGSTDLYKGGEIKEPKMCLDCFAEMVGFTRTSNGFVESDEVTDIRNHLSPITKVIDHG